MKIRTSFVSNSSSSSFLVLLKEEPKNARHLRKLVFSDPANYGDIDHYLYNPYPVTRDSLSEDEKDQELGEGINYFDTLDVAKYLFKHRQKEVCKLVPSKRWEVVEFIKKALMSGGVCDSTLAVGYPEYPSWEDESDNLEGTKTWEEFYAEEKQWAISHAEYLADILLKNYKGQYLCIFKASDNGDGRLGMATEHGETFQHCFHLRFSHH